MSENRRSNHMLGNGDVVGMFVFNPCDGDFVGIRSMV